MKIPNGVVILANPKKPNDARETAKEADRVGLESHIHWNTTSRFNEYIPRRLLSSRFLSEPNRMACYIGHYMIVKSALEMGLDSVWVLEDDCKFLKDKDMIWDKLSLAPKDADFLILDGIPTRETRHLVNRNANGWQEVSCSIDVRSAGNYIVSRSAMAEYVRHLDGSSRGRLPLASDVGRNSVNLRGKKVYFIFPPLSIQCPPGGKSNTRCSTSWEWMSKYWREVGVDVSNYV